MNIILYLDQNQNPHVESYNTEDEKHDILIRVLEEACLKYYTNFFEDFGVAKRNYKSMKCKKLFEYVERCLGALDGPRIYDLANGIFNESVENSSTQRVLVLTNHNQEVAAESYSTQTEKNAILLKLVKRIIKENYCVPESWEGKKPSQINLDDVIDDINDETSNSGSGPSIEDCESDILSAGL